MMPPMFSLTLPSFVSQTCLCSGLRVLLQEDPVAPEPAVTLIQSHLCNDEAATAEARRHKRDNVPHAFLRVTAAPRTAAPGSRLPDPPAT